MLRIGAIVLAAGEGKRMGACKPLLPLGASTVLAHVAKTLLPAINGPLVVVTGHHGDAVTAEALRLSLETAENTTPQDGMFSSVRTGLAHIVGRVDGVLVLPADIPFVRTATCALVVEAFRRHRAAVTYPTLCGERGHPPLLDADTMRAVLASSGDGGLRGVLLALERQGGTTHDVAVADEGIVTDMDTPADHAQLVARHPLRHIPTPREREALLEMAGTPARVRAHCRMVARAALAMAAHLEATRRGFISPFARQSAPHGISTSGAHAEPRSVPASTTTHAMHAEGNTTLPHTATAHVACPPPDVTTGPVPTCQPGHMPDHMPGTARDAAQQAPAATASPQRLDRPLIHAAATLHDICKGTQRHEAAGGALLTRHGFPEVGSIIAAHRDIAPQAGPEIDEAALVMLADKYVRGVSLIPVEERFDERLREWAHRPDVACDIAARKARVLMVRDLFESETATELFPLLQRKVRRGTF